MSRHRCYRASTETCARSTDRSRAGVSASRSSPSRSSARLELDVLVGSRERPTGDEAEPRFGHSRALRMDEAELPDRRIHRLVVHELLDAMQRRLAPLAVELACLLAEEPVDVGIAAVHEGAAGDHEGLEADRRVAEGAADAVGEVLQLLLLVALEERRALERAEPGPDADRSEIVGYRLAHGGRRRFAPEVARVESVRVAGLGEQSLCQGGIVSVGRRLPEEVEALGDDAPRDSREAERDRVVHRLA